MLELFLIRHAKSSHFESGFSDFSRTLNARGERDAPRMGRRLAGRHVSFDLMLSSPARRAIDTARLIAREVHYPPGEIREVETFYNADADTLLAEVQRTDPGCRRLAVVAHNPGISWLCQLLTGDVIDMPTCAVAAIHFDMDDWRAVHSDAGWVADYDYPAKPDGG